MLAPRLAAQPSAVASPARAAHLTARTGAQVSETKPRSPPSSASPLPTSLTPPAPAPRRAGCRPGHAGRGVAALGDAQAPRPPLRDSAGAAAAAAALRRRFPPSERAGAPRRRPRGRGPVRGRGEGARRAARGRVPGGRLGAGTRRRAQPVGMDGSETGVARCAGTVWHDRGPPPVPLCPTAAALRDDILRRVRAGAGSGA